MLTMYSDAHGGLCSPATMRLAYTTLIAVQRALRFSPPERVYAVGSWASSTMAKPKRLVDVALLMPKSCFDEKDQLNNRYFARRIQYLTEIASALQGAPDFEGVTWDVQQHDARWAWCRHMPVLLHLLKPL